MNTLGITLHQIRQRLNYGIWSYVIGLILLPLWQFYKRIVKLPLVVQTYMNTSFILKPNCVISSRFVYEKCPDENFIRTLADFGDETTHFVDVGANVGLYSALLFDQFKSVHAFEPNSVAADRLEENLGVNLAKNTTVYRAAAGSSSGTVRFPLLDIPLPTAAIIEDDDDSTNTIEVEMLSLDDVLPNEGELVVKIDVEGHDAAVLEGLTRRLATGQVRICLFEATNQTVLEKILTQVSGSGYVIHDGNRKINAVKETRCHDLFLVRENLVHQLTS